MGPQKPLDSGSFIAGFLSSFLGSSSGNLGNSSNSGASSSMKPQNGNGGVSLNISLLWQPSSCLQFSIFPIFCVFGTISSNKID